MKMGKPSPEMQAAINSTSPGDPRALVIETAVAGIKTSDDGPPPAVLFLIRTADGTVSLVTMMSQSQVAEYVAGLLAASKAVFGTNEHTESQGKPIN